MRTRHLIGLLTATAALMSCSLDTGDDGPQIAIYLSLDKGVLEPANEGEVATVAVTVTARNVGYEPFTLTGPSDCLLLIEVYNSSDNRVYSSAASCLGTTVTEELAAGADKIMTFTWSGTNTGGGLVQSGLYNIVGIANVTGRTYAGPPATIAVVGG